MNMKSLSDLACGLIAGSNAVYAETDLFGGKVKAGVSNS